MLITIERPVVTEEAKIYALKSMDCLLGALDDGILKESDLLPNIMVKISQYDQRSTLDLDLDALSRHQAELRALAGEIMHGYLGEIALFNELSRWEQEDSPTLDGSIFAA